MQQRQEPLFDPYLFITELGADVRLVGEEGARRVKLSWWKGIPHQKRRQGERVARAYSRLLHLQLQAEPPHSVQKLLAHGKIAVAGGRFVLKDGPND